MQRVVRSTLAGILATAALVGCGDKVTVPPPTTTPPGTVVHSVTVSPASVSLAVGQKATLAASVDADAGVAVRTVTWSSSNTAVATVGTDGTVTGVTAGTATIIAAATAAPDVKGAAAVTVTSAQSSAPNVLITAINQNPTGQPANLAGAAGQLDVVLNVDPNGQPLKSVSATMTCPGPTTMTQTQTTAAPPPASANSAEQAAAVVSLSFPTNAFTVNASSVGVPTLRNGACTISATATTGSSTTQTASATTQLTLANADGVVITNTFQAITNIEGAAQPTSANDAFGLPWHSGGVTVQGIPVLYSNRTLASVTITLPGAAGGSTQTITAAPYQAVWSGSASNGTRVTGLTLVDQTGCGGAVPPACGLLEVNGATPKGVTPTVIALDVNGNDLGLVTLGGGTNSTFRLDNTAPQSPLAFNIAARQAGWVNATYNFTNTGVGNSNGNVNSTQNFVSCGDGPSPAQSPAGTFVCLGQIGVSASSNNAVGVGTGSTNGNTTFTYYAIPASQFVAASATNGTSTSATACSISGWTKIATPNDLAASQSSTAYVVRVFERDALLNERCSDLAKAPTAAGQLGQQFNTGIANNYTNSAATFGVDKVAPTVALVDPKDCPVAPAGPPNGCVGPGDTASYGIASIGAPPSFFLSMTDDASGFSTTPVVTKLTRIAVDPSTGVQSQVNTAFGCPVGFSANAGACQTASAPNGLFIDAALTGNPATFPSSNVDGYYTWTGTANDLARNTAPTLTRTAVIDRAAPTMGSIASPASLVGGTSASFATSAADNLDLISYDYTLTYPVAVPGANGAIPAASLPIRSPNNATSQQINTKFSGTIKPSASFSLVVNTFIRSVATTNGGVNNQPMNNPQLAGSITSRVYDAGNNKSTPNIGTGAGFSNIAAASISTTTPITNFAAPQSNGASFNSFSIANAVANISNCPTAGCTGNAAAANATSVNLVATASGSEGTTFQFLNPFTQVQFYYFDTVSGEWILAGSTVAPSVSDNPTATIRTFSWTLNFDPPASIAPPGPPGAVNAVLNLIAVGVNTAGDALTTQVNGNITMTNP